MIYGISSPTYTSKMLTTSTTHIPMDTQKALVAGLEDVTYTPTDYGWLFNLVDVKCLTGHTSLKALLEFAVALEYDYLMLDGDGPKMPEELLFPMYHW